VAREITKLHEKTYRGSLAELKARAQADADFGRGEIVLLIAGAPAISENGAAADGYGGALDRVLKVLLAELPLKQAARLAAQITEARDNEAYKRALHLKEESASH
jgi:16S rRNA (cytidine1402-2'-O)-methyltransferase